MTFNLGSGYQVVAGTTYALQINSDTNGLNLQVDTTGTYPRGCYLSANDAQSWWNTHNNAWDIWFEEWGGSGSVTPAPPLTITTPSPLPDGKVGVDYSQTLTAAGGVAPYTWSTPFGMPAGLSLNATTGVISGTPTIPDSGLITFKVTDSASNTATKMLSMTFLPSGTWGLFENYHATQDNTGMGLHAAQTFSPLATHTLTQIKLKIFNAGATGYVMVSLRAVDASNIPVPTGLNLVTSSPVAVSSIPSGWNIVTFNMGGGYQVVAGMTYAIQINSDTNGLNLQVDTSGTYPRGCYLSANDAQSWWNDHNNAWDIWFEEWGGSGSIPTNTITASAGQGGSITPSGTITVNKGANQAFTIAPNSGYVIANVLVDGTSAGPVTSYSFSNVTANHSISASFSAIPTSNQSNPYGTVYNFNLLFYSITGTTGRVDTTIKKVVVLPNGNLQFVFEWTAPSPTDIYKQPDVGNTNMYVTDEFGVRYDFVDWGGGAAQFLRFYSNSLNQTGWYLCPGPTNGAKSFVFHDDDQGKQSPPLTLTGGTALTGPGGYELPNFFVTANASYGGYIIPSGLALVRPFSTYNFTLIPYPVYHVKDIKVNGVSIGGVSNYTFQNVTQNYTIFAEFALDEPTPAVVTVAASNVTRTSAVLVGNLTSLGNVAALYVGFDWGALGDAGHQEVYVANTNSTGTFSLKLDGLQPNTAYSFKAIAKVDGGFGGSSWSTTGSQVTFNNTDVIAPGQVTNLAAVDITATWITLNWTAPGDNGYEGTATTYDIRYFNAPINNLNWDIATRIIDGLLPASTGSPQTLTVYGLSPDSTYYFALKTADLDHNWSVISNVATGRTPAADAMLTLDISVDGNGTVIYPGVGKLGPYYPKQRINILAVPELGNAFVGWTGNVQAIADPNQANTTIIMDGNYTISAVFVPVVTVLTLNATDIGRNTTVSCNLYSMLSATRALIYFEWGVDTNYGNTIVLGEVTTPGIYSMILYNLRPDTTFHYRVVAVCPGVGSAFGADMTFTTPSYPYN